MAENIKDKLGLKEILNIDGAASYSKVSKILAEIGDQKAVELKIIPPVHSRNGNKRLFRYSDVVEWIDR